MSEDEDEESVSVYSNDPSESSEDQEIEQESESDSQYERNDVLIDLVSKAIRSNYSSGIVARTILLAIQNFTNLTIDPKSRLRDINFILELQSLSQSHEPMGRLIRILPIDYSNTLLEDYLFLDWNWLNKAINDISSQLNSGNPTVIEYKGYMINVIGLRSIPHETIVEDKLCIDQERNNCGAIVLDLADYSMVTTGSSRRITEPPRDTIVLEELDSVRGNRYHPIPNAIVYHMIRALMGEYNNQSIGSFTYDFAEQIIKRTYIKLVLNYNQNTNITELGIKLDSRV